jgi:hypothetical protein
MNPIDINQFVLQNFSKLEHLNENYFGNRDTRNHFLELLNSHFNTSLESYTLYERDIIKTFLNYLDEFNKKPHKRNKDKCNIILSLLTEHCFGCQLKKHGHGHTCNVPRCSDMNVNACIREMQRLLEIHTLHNTCAAVKGLLMCNVIQ